MSADCVTCGVRRAKPSRSNRDNVESLPSGHCYSGLQSDILVEFFARAGHPHSFRERDAVSGNHGHLGHDIRELRRPILASAGPSVPGNLNGH